MEGVLLLPTILLLLAAPFICLNTYLVVWICGPAIRRAGKCFEQGRIKAMVEEERRLGPDAVGETMSAPRPLPVIRASAPARPSDTAGNFRDKDAGHRWLGEPGAKKA